MKNFKKPFFRQRIYFFSRIVILFLVLSLNSKNGFSQDFSWAKTFTTESPLPANVVGNSNLSRITKIDSDGNIIVISNLQSSNAMNIHDFGNGVVINSPNTTPGIAGSAGKNINMAIAKYNTVGTCLWAKVIGGSLDFDDIMDLDIDENNNIYISGHTGRLYSINDGEVIQFGNNKSLTITNCENYPERCYNGFIAKYDSNGNCQWVERTISRFSAKLSVKNGELYVLSNLYGIGGASEAAFVDAFNTNTGGFLWRKTFDNVTLGSIRVYQNNIIVGGSKGSTSSNGSYTYIPYFAKLNINNGNIVWQRTLLLEDSSIRKIGIHQATGNIYLTIGWNRLASYTINGDPILAPKTLFNMASVNFSSGGDVSDMIVDNNEKIWIVGGYRRDLGIGFGSITIPGVGSYTGENGFIAQINSSGDVERADKIDNLGTGVVYLNDASVVRLNSVALDIAGNLFVGGSLVKTANFSRCSNNSNLVSSSRPDFADGFLVKYSSINPKPIIIGQDVICGGSTIYGVTGVPANAVITWEVSPNLQIVSGQGTSQLTVTPSASVVNGEGGYIQAKLNGSCVDPAFRSVWIGKPRVLSGLWDDNFNPLTEATLYITLPCPRNSPPRPTHLPIVYFFAQGINTINALDALDVEDIIGNASQWLYTKEPVFPNMAKWGIRFMAPGYYEFRVRAKNTNCANAYSDWLVFKITVVDDPTEPYCTEPEPPSDICYDEWGQAYLCPSGYRYYPNTVQNELNVEYNESYQKAELYNKFNKKVLDINLEKKKSKKVYLQDIPNGIYFLHLIDSKGKRIRKQIVIQK